LKGASVQFSALVVVGDGKGKVGVGKGRQPKATGRLKKAVNARRRHD